MTTIYQHLTPEAKLKRKKRKKAINYILLILLTIVVSALVTMLVNQV